MYNLKLCWNKLLFSGLLIIFLLFFVTKRRNAYLDVKDDYILWPSLFLLDTFPCLPSRADNACISMLPMVEPLPRTSAPKKKPSCDAIIRSTHHYSPFVNTLLRSIEIFWPTDMGKIIVILNDSEVDRSYALTLPDYVTVFFEQIPPFRDLWPNKTVSEHVHVSRKPHYDRAQWSHLISDRYSSADFITIFDADQVISGGGQLQLLFEWDVKMQEYKPIFTCFDDVDLYPSFTLSYKMFGMTRNVGIECMKSLPVMLRRDTLPKVRKYLVNYFLVNSPSIYNDYRLANVSIDYDRDFNWTKYVKADLHSYGIASSVTYFDRAFAFLSENSHICQFCIFGGYIYSHPKESEKYAFKIIGYVKSAERLKNEQIYIVNYARDIDNHRLDKKGIVQKYRNDYHIYTPECTQIHSGAHVPYMIDTPKLSENYFALAERILDDGLCKVSRPEDCNYKYCKSRGWNYDAIKQRELHPHSFPNISFPAPFYSSQQVLLGWQRNPLAPGGLPACRGINYAMLHHYFEWIQRFETKQYTHFKLRQCRG